MVIYSTCVSFLISTSSNIAMTCQGQRVSMPGWKDVSLYSDRWRVSDFHGNLKMNSTLDHLSSCLHADSKAQLQTPPSEILGQSLFTPRLPADAHGTQISLRHRRAFLWGAVDFNSWAEQSSRWSMQRGHTSGAVDSGCCLGPWLSKETKVRDTCTWRSICEMRQDEILMVEFDQMP